jgi:hypothetical protein
MKRIVKPRQENTCIHISFQNGFKQGDASLPPTFNFILEYTIRKLKENQGGLKLSWYITWSTMTISTYGARARHVFSRCARCAPPGKFVPSSVYERMIYLRRRAVIFMSFCNASAHIRCTCTPGVSCEGTAQQPAYVLYHGCRGNARRGETTDDRTWVHCSFSAKSCAASCNHSLTSVEVCCGALLSVSRRETIIAVLSVCYFLQ